MHLSSPAPFPSFLSSGARTEFQDSDGFATDMIESEMQDVRKFIMQPLCVVVTCSVCVVVTCSVCV